MAAVIAISASCLSTWTSAPTTSVTDCAALDADELLDRLLLLVENGLADGRQVPDRRQQVRAEAGVDVRQRLADLRVQLLVAARHEREQSRPRLLFGDTRGSCLCRLRLR